MDPVPVDSRWMSIPNNPNILIKLEWYTGDDGAKWPQARAYIKNDTPVVIQLIGFGRRADGSISIEHGSLQPDTKNEPFTERYLKRGHNWYIGWVFETDTRKSLFGQPLMKYYGDAAKYC